MYSIKDDLLNYLGILWTRPGPKRLNATVTFMSLSSLIREIVTVPEKHRLVMVPQEVVGQISDNSDCFTNEP